MENIFLSDIHWKYVDEIYKDGKLIDVIEGSNLVVNNCMLLLAGLMAGKLNGIQYWAIGSGNPQWDTQWDTIKPPSPSVTNEKLVAEIFRKPITKNGMKYIDEFDKELSDDKVTNRIKISVTIGENEGNGNWREFGLFGGNSKSAKDTGIMIDHKYHKILYKTSEISVTRSIILTFNH